VSRCSNLVLAVGLPLIFGVAGCGGGGSGTTTPTTYTVAYQGNGNTSGSVPVDAREYAPGHTVNVLGNISGLVRTYCTFSGWNTQANGSGAAYASGAAFTMGSADVVLYAQWTANPGSVIGYAYVANRGTACLSQFYVLQDGTLAAMNPPMVATGSDPMHVTVHPSGSYVYVANHGDDPGGVSQYTVGADGTLTAMSPTDKVPTGDSLPGAMVISPNGKYLYVANALSADNPALSSITEFSIGSTGALTVVRTISYGFNLTGMAFAPNGDSFFVCTFYGEVDQYSAYASGQIAFQDSITVGNGAGNLQALALTPDGEYLYAVDLAGQVVWQFGFDNFSDLNLLSTVALPVGAKPTGITVDPAGDYCYVANSGTPNTAISRFTIGSGGALTAASTVSRPNALGGANWVTVDPTGKFLYSANTDDNVVCGYHVAGGALTALNPASVAGGYDPESIAVWMK